MSIIDGVKLSQALGAIGTGASYAFAKMSNGNLKNAAILSGVAGSAAAFASYSAFMDMLSSNLKSVQKSLGDNNNPLIFSALFLSSVDTVASSATIGEIARITARLFDGKAAVSIQSPSIAPVRVEPLATQILIESHKIG